MKNNDWIFEIMCTESRDSRFKVGELYYVDKDGIIVDGTHFYGGCTSTSSYKEWYEKCNWTDYAFKLITDRTQKEEQVVRSNGKLNKGIDSELVQDTYRAVIDHKGNISFNSVKMLNLCFVKFDDNDKVYTFNNPSDKRLDAGTKVIVDTVRGQQQATVISSIKIQEKYLRDLQKAMCGKAMNLRNVLAVLERKEVFVETPLVYFAQ